MNIFSKELIFQIAKFGIVGFLAFCIDYCLFLFLTYTLGVNYLVASAISFIVSLVFNFVASMRYVFAGKEGQTRTEQFIIFVTLSVIGLAINQIVLWLCVAVIDWIAWFGKIIATVVVMIFNFVTRKIFLEERSIQED